MSESAAKLKAALKQMLDKGDEVFAAVVQSVNEDDCTCVVLADEMEIADVRLRATINGNNGFIIFPAVESTVLVQRLGEKEEFFITMFSEIDGVLIQKDNDTLKLLVNDLCDKVKAISTELQKVVVAIGVTPDVPALVQINADIDAIKGRNEQLFK